MPLKNPPPFSCWVGGGDNAKLESLRNVIILLSQISLSQSFAQCCWLHKVDNAARHQIFVQVIIKIGHPGWAASTNHVPILLGMSVWIEFTSYIPKTQKPLCFYLTIICTLSMFIAELTLPMGESTLKVLISLKHHLCIVVDVHGQVPDL